LEARHRWAAELVGEYRLLDCSDDLREILDSKHSGKILETITSFGTAMRSAVVVSLGADKAAQTVQALHNYAHSNHSTEPERISLATEIDVVLELLHSGMHRRISIVRNYTEDIFIHGMRDPLNQVWMNLIKNALHAMEYRGTLTLTIERAVTPGVVCVAISDTGHGIPEHIRSHLFEPYVTTKEDGEGIGIGLDICKQIIERHDGSIEFETHADGTTFSVYLPTVGSGDTGDTGTSNGGTGAIETERNHKPNALSSAHLLTHNYGDLT
ncbi:MAG: HAMP domain-containing histidine kinase, partial [Spirochaeta sp.]|nr:HAMP domain-containing histidine kinase [Spirochaeta sp.]